MKKRHQQKLVVLSIALFVMLNAPILLLFNSSEPVFGFPLVYIYIFTVWFLSSVASFLVLKNSMSSSVLFILLIGYLGLLFFFAFIAEKKRKSFCGQPIPISTHFRWRSIVRLGRIMEASALLPKVDWNISPSTLVQ